MCYHLRPSALCPLDNSQQINKSSGTPLCCIRGENPIIRGSDRVGSGDWMYFSASYRLFC